MGRDIYMTDRQFDNNKKICYNNYIEKNDKDNLRKVSLTFALEA